MDKSNIERMCRDAGLTPEKREPFEGMDIFVADGFVAQPHVTFRRFGIESGEFPFGCFATLWWTAYGEQKFDVGRPIFFNAFHDPQYDKETKKRARVNTAVNDARDFIRQRNKARLDA